MDPAWHQQAVSWSDVKFAGKPTFIEPLTSIICLNLTPFMQYGLGESMPARAVVPTGPLHFGSKIEIEAVTSQFLNN
jgi:hypothetical protein